MSHLCPCISYGHCGNAVCVCVCVGGGGCSGGEGCSPSSWWPGDICLCPYINTMDILVRQHVCVCAGVGWG